MLYTAIDLADCYTAVTLISTRNANRLLGGCLRYPGYLTIIGASGWRILFLAGLY
jgi:hypothetical protein